MPRAKRTDQNHAEIRDGLRAEGYEVVDTSGRGCGIPDLIARTKRYKRAFWLEVKMPGEKLTKAEQEFFDLFPALCFKVETLEEAIHFLEGHDEEEE